MTKDEYFAALRQWCFCGFPVDNDLPREWIMEAWDLPEVQSEVVDSFARHVSKTGSLCYDLNYLTQLSQCLSEEQVRRLYLAIRELAGREAEFRLEFLRGFAKHCHAIPLALTRDEIAAQLGFTSAEEMDAHDERTWAEYESARLSGEHGEDAIPF